MLRENSGRVATANPGEKLVEGGENGGGGDLLKGGREIQIWEGEGGKLKKSQKFHNSRKRREKKRGVPPQKEDA